MRRLWIVVATVAACAGLAGQTSIAYAESGNTHAANSCSDLIKKYRSFASAESNAFGPSGNPTSPTSAQKVYASIAKALNKLASSGPSALRTAFKHRAQYVSKLAHVDFSNPSSLQALAGSVQQVQPDIRKIQAYFGTTCHYTPSTT